MSGIPYCGSRPAGRILIALPALTLAIGSILMSPVWAQATELPDPSQAVRSVSQGPRILDGGLSRLAPERPPLRGLGEVPGDLISTGPPSALSAPRPSPASIPDIDENLAIRLAAARARWQWGDAVRLGSVTPLYGLDGELQAYDVDFTLNGEPFGDYASVARGWQADRAERRLELQKQEEEAAGGHARSPRRTGSERFTRSSMRLPSMKSCTFLSMLPPFSTKYL